MFENLVESGSHKEDLARKSSFFLGTLAVYAVLITAFVVGGIYLYDAHLENENLELVALVAPVPVQQQEPEQPKNEPKPQKIEQQVATRTELIARVDDATKVPDKPATVAAKVPPIPPNVRVVRGTTNTDPVGPVGPVGPVSTGASGPIVKVEDDDPPPPPPKPTPPPKPKTVVSGGVLNGKAISKPQPPYPPIAKAARASGPVTVQILVDESGRVVSATAVSGHPLLRAAAEGAARQARFTPTQLSGQPVKVSGVITYNFQLQ